MAAVTPLHNIAYATSSDPEDLAAASAAQATSVDAELDKRQNYDFIFANVTAQGAETRMVAGSRAWRQDLLAEMIYNGSGWIPYNSEWQAWTPVYTNLVIGAGTTDIARWRYSGGLVEWEWEITLGTGFSVGAVYVTPPVPISANMNQGSPLGQVIAIQTVNLFWSAVICNIVSGVRYIQPMRTGTGGAGGGLSAFTNLQPGTWLSGHQIKANGRYAV